MTRYTFLLLALLLPWMPVGFAQEQEIAKHDQSYYADHTEALVFKSESGGKIPYRLFMPPDYDPKKQYPLVLSFHGAGQRGKDNLQHLSPWVAGWIDPEVQKAHPCIILMPQCPKGQQWVESPFSQGSYDFESVPESKPMKLVKELFDTILKEKSIDQSRIYVMGVSMGGYGTWNFVMRYPEIAAAAIPICGGSDPSMAATLKDLPIWAFHGDADTIVPPSGTQEMVDAVRKAGGTGIKLTIYEGEKHGAYTRPWKSPELVEWVFSHVKATPVPGADKVE